MKKLINALWLVRDIVRYNFKIIFANKFIYFLLSAIAVFMLVTSINLFSTDAMPTEATVYYLLLVPGILLVFYPVTFGIQNDLDAGMLEILFGIPNYRYKVWLLRLVIIYFAEFLFLLALALISALAVTEVPLLAMVFQLMFPLLFLGSLAFVFSTWVRNGYGTAIVMIIIGLAFWIASGFLMESKWNLFLNPFHVPSQVNEAIWADITFKNRVYLVAGTVVAILLGLLNLQKREKFV